MESIGHERTHRPRPLPSGRQQEYQFPVYRWLSWIVIGGYLAGLGAMYLVAGMFGIPAPIGWAILTVILCAGIALLDRPKVLMATMMFYFLLMPSNRLLGLLGLPLPGFIDELLFVPIVAVIVMYLIQGHSIRGGNWFPVCFGLIAFLSWYVNGKGGIFPTVRILLVNLKFFLIWYFCRLTQPFKNARELFRWCWFFILFAAAQFLYNVLWQRALWPRLHPDISGGVFGPGGGAHTVGYISVIALFLLGGWNASRKEKMSGRLLRQVLLVGVVILYDLVFMTDTKHVLVLAPVACTALLFLPGVSARFRAWSIALAFLILASGTIYVRSMDIGNYLYTLRNFGTTPKGQLFKAVTVDFPYLVRYPILGAGPAKFASDAARENRAPLARRYITPYYDEADRLQFYGRKGSTVISSIAGSVNTDFFFITSEFGWLGEAVYLSFWFYCVFSLYRKGVRARQAGSESWGIFFALAICLNLFLMLQLLTTICTVPCLAFPIWLLVGRIWDMEVSPQDSAPAPSSPALLYPGDGDDF